MKKTLELKKETITVLEKQSMNKIAGGFPTTIATGSDNYTKIKLCMTEGCSVDPCIKTGNCLDDTCVCPSINYVC